VRSGKIAKWPIPEDAYSGDTRLPARLISNENLMLIQAARSGLGIACVPNFTVAQYLKSGELTMVLENEVQREIVWWAVWPASPHLPPKLSVFLDFLSSRFAVLEKQSLPRNVAIA
jgi:DNA-binding transcriptional LysR family regulator